MRLIFFVIFLNATILQAKVTGTFVVNGDHVKNETVQHGGYLENSKITILNTSKKPIWLVWETVGNTFPKEWDCSMCQYGKCQISIPKGSEFKKLEAGKEGFIAIHILPGGHSGNGVVKFRIYDREHPEYFEILTFSIQVL